MAHDRIDPGDQISEADLVEQLSPPVPERGGVRAARPSPSQVAVVIDPLVEVAVRMYAEFADRATLPEILAIIERCRRYLDTPSAAALPETVERLTRQRLAEDVDPRRRRQRIGVPHPSDCRDRAET